MQSICIAMLSWYVNLSIAAKIHLKDNIGIRFWGSIQGMVVEGVVVEGVVVDGVVVQGY